MFKLNKFLERCGFTMKIRVGITEGCNTVEVNFNDGTGWQQNELALHTAATELTGCYNCGTRLFFFDGKFKILYGNQVKEFYFPTIFEKGKEQERLLERINEIKKWIATADYFVEFEVQ